VELTHPPLQQLLDYWQRKAAGRPFPQRADIDPLELRFALGNLLLVELAGSAPVRFRYRLWGIVLSEDYGHDMTSRHVDELQPAELAREVQRAYEEVVATGQPASRQFDNVIGGRWFTHERLLLPLGTVAAPDRIGMILGAIFRSPLPDRDVPLSPA